MKISNVPEERRNDFNLLCGFVEGRFGGRRIKQLHGTTLRMHGQSQNEVVQKIFGEIFAVIEVGIPYSSGGCS